MRILYIILLFIYILLLTKAEIYKVFVNNENELLNSLDKDTVDGDELNIKINDSSIEIFDNINVNKTLNKLIISGGSKKSSILKFRNISSGFFLKSAIKEVEICNITIYGHLDFKSFINVTIENVELHGSISYNDYYDYYNIYDFDYFDINDLIEVIEKNDGKGIYFNNFTYYGATDEKIKNCIEIYGSSLILNSHLYSNSSCLDSLFFQDGGELSAIDIKNVYFDGNYSNNCVDLNNNFFSTITSCIFEKCSAYYDGGGAVRLCQSNLDVLNCKFKDIYTSYSGAVFEIKDGYIVNIQNITAINANAKIKGGFIDVSKKICFYK